MKTLISNLFYLSLFVYQAYAQQPNYFPISIGNEYQMYDGFEYQYCIIERDTIYPNGKTYFHLPSPFDFQDCRVDSLGNIFSISKPFFGGGPEEHLLFKADANLNEEWIISDSINPLGHQGFGKCIFDDSLYVFGELKKVKGTLIFENSYYHYFFWLAMGIGLIREAYDDGTISNLNFARIDGKEYGILVSVDEEIFNIPNEFIISQNYPNPFNSLTKIDVRLPGNSFDQSIKMVIYNILGSTIYEKDYVVNNSITISINTEEFGISSGAYFYSIIYKNKYLTRKFLLLK